MPNRLVFLSVSDPRGDLDFVAKAIALAQSKDVQAQGVFFLGNFAGPLLTKPEQLTLDTSRRTLQHELKSHEQHYKELGIFNVWGLINLMARYPERYRRGAEVTAVNFYRQLLGRRDDHGRFVEFGSGAKKARAIYQQAAKLLARSKVPCFLMADTIFAEELPDQHWLHFSWVSLSGFSMRCLGASEIDDPETIPEFFMGPRRGGRLVRLESYPFASADVVFAYALSPVLHEVLSTHEKRLAILCGDGQIDTGYPRNIMSTQRAGFAYVYSLDGTKVVRSAYGYAGGVFNPPKVEDGSEPSTTTKFRRRGIKRAEIETQVKLAGIGTDLVVFVDLLRRENPDLADQMEKAENRAEAIFRYIQYLELQRHSLRQTLAAERAGLERLINRMARYFTEEQTARLQETLRNRPDSSAGVEAQDAANEGLAELISQLIAERFGPVPGSSAALPVPPRPEAQAATAIDPVPPKPEPQPSESQSDAGQV